MSPHPTDGELYRMVTELRDENRRAHEEMISEQKRTNGRLRSLEVWKAYILGGLSILALLNIPMKILELLTQ